MTFLKGVIDQVRREKSGGLISVTLLYSITAVVAGVWLAPLPTCQMSPSPWSLLQCGVLAAAPWVVAMMLVVMALTLVVTHRRPSSFMTRTYVTVGGVVVYVLVVGGWVTAYSLL